MTYFLIHFKWSSYVKGRLHKIKFPTICQTFFVFRKNVTDKKNKKMEQNVKTPHFDRISLSIVYTFQEINNVILSFKSITYYATKLCF